MTACPDANLILHFASGSLAAAESTAIEAHIDTCDGCRAALSSLARRGGPATSFGRYRLETVLGSGGMGIVYRAWDPQLARPVAIKVVKHVDDGEPLRARLVREAQSLARLSHPNVCHVYDVGGDGDEVWIAMELIDGSTLRQWADQRAAAELLAVLLAVAEGLAAAHEAGIVHRDVKPENVLVTCAGRAVVTDFGLARIAPLDESRRSIAGAGAADLTHTGGVAGTPPYLAPEQLTGGAIDARVDQFAWAVMAWELLTGTRPFPIAADARLAAIVAGVAPSPKLASAISGPLSRALAADATDRFPSMRALIEAVRAPATPPRTRRRAALAVSAVVLASGASVAGWRWSREAAPAQLAVAPTHVDPWATPDAGRPMTIEPPTRALAQDAEATLVQWCHLPLDVAHPEPALGSAVADWGKVTRRARVIGTLANPAHTPMAVTMYEVVGQRGTYQFQSDYPDHNELDAQVGDLAVVCPYAKNRTLELPAPWTSPPELTAVQFRLSAPPRIAELAALAPLHVQTIVELERAPRGRNYLIRATFGAVHGERWDMAGWSLDVAPDIAGARLAVAGETAWIVVDHPVRDKARWSLHARAIVDTMLPR